MRNRRSLVISLTALSVTFSQGCTREEAPLEDGLRLVYRWKVATDRLHLDMTIREDGDEHFLLDIVTEKNGNTDRARIRVDRFFRLESGKRAGLGETPFWLPSSRRRAGAHIVPDGSIAMRRETVWKGWNVWMGGGGSLMGGGEWYYERETGFLVGFRVESMGSGMSLELLETNVPGLKPSGNVASSE